MSDEDRRSGRGAPTDRGRATAGPEGPARGDATLGRIAELAGGWSVGGDQGAAQSPDLATAASKKPSLPPPRPGKTAPPPPRAAAASRPPAPKAPLPDEDSLELPLTEASAARASAAAPAASAAVPAAPTAPAQTADKGGTAVVAPAPRASSEVEVDVDVSGELPVSTARPEPPERGSQPAVPVGEFDAPKGARHLLDPKLEVRGDPTMIDASHLRTDQTEIREAKTKVADAGIAATLRHAQALPRRRGLWGDLRYVFTVAFGLRRAKRELAQREREQSEREQLRRRHLTAIGRTAAGAAELDQTQVRRTRDSLSHVADDRDKLAAQVAACEAEMEAVRKERAAKGEAHREELEKLQEEQKALLAKLEPLQREAAAARRKATDLRNTLIKLDGRIRNVDAGRGKWADEASRAAELAALRAERQGVARDEPAMAAALDSIVPRIASIEAARERIRRKIEERQEEEEEDRKRSDELLAAIGAKRKVVERATADAEKARERMLADLGERLYVDRPSDLSAHLAPIDSIDLELGDGQRRIMEIKEILASVDRFKLARGIVWWILIAAAIAAAAILLRPMIQ